MNGVKVPEVKVQPRINPDVKLTVHMVPHTHDDVGWLKTYDDYFTGQQGGVQITQRVQGILDAVVFELI